MSITGTTLTRAAAFAAMYAGLAYVAVQFIHPADEIASLSTQPWVNVHILSFTEAVLALVGITGIYLRQVRQFGILGLVSYVMLGFFFVLQASFNFAEAFIAPLIAVSAPQLATDFAGLFGRYAAVTDLGALAALPKVGAILYVGGALLFGISIIRARVLSRGAGILMIVAAVITPVAGALLPHALERMAAVPMGLAIACLGYSLWADLRKNKINLKLSVDESRIDRTAAV